MRNTDRSQRDKRVSLPIVSRPVRTVYSSMEGRLGDESMHQFILLHQATVPYVSQSYSWDCGLACTEMALRARGVKHVSINLCYA